MFSFKSMDSAQDLEAIRVFSWEFRSFLLGLDPKEKELVGLYYPPDEYDAQIDAMVASCVPPDGEVRLVLKDGAIVGCGMYHVLDADTAEIKRIYLQEVARGSGTGHRLMLHLIELCRARGIKRVVLETGIFQAAAVKLYKAMGFRICDPYQEIPGPARDYIIAMELGL